MSDLLNFSRVFRAARYSWQGLRHAARHESAFRQELAIATVLVPLGLWLGQSGVEKALLIGSVLLVLIVELLNTAIEAAINRIGPEQHPLSGQAKDMGSAAVFIALLSAAITWFLILA
jgi:diacylglycerol kinase (ATP)